jgi:hypothetical protein
LQKFVEKFAIRKKVRIFAFENNRHKVKQKMIANATNPNSLRQHIIALEVGQSIFISMDEHAESTARHYASLLGFKFNRTYRTRIDRANRGYLITREA